MSTKFTKVKQGQAFAASPAMSAAWLNSVTDMLSAYNEGRIGTPGAVLNTDTTENLISIKNETGAALERGHACRVSDYLLNAADPRKKWYEALASDEEFKLLFAIADRPIPSGKIGPAWIGGVCLVVCDDDPLAGEYWGPKPGQAELAWNYPGCRVLDVVDPENKIAQVKILGISQFYAKATAEIAEDTVSTDTDYKVMVGEQGEETEGEWTTVPPAFNRGGVISAGDPCWVAEGQNGLFIGKLC